MNGMNRVVCMTGMVLMTEITGMTRMAMMII